MQLEENIIILQWDDTGHKFVDLFKCLSVINRRLNRQYGLANCLAAKYNVVQTPPNEGAGTSAAIQISGAPRTWIVRNSLVKAFNLWKDQNKRAYDASSPSIKGKWRDFKVYLNEDHKDAEILGNDLKPHSGGILGNTGPYLVPHEWKYSTIVSVDATPAGGSSEIDTDTLPLIILGDNDHGTGGHWGIVQSYQESRATVQEVDPNLPSGVDMMGNMYAQGESDLSLADEELISQAIVDGDEAPYDIDRYPGAMNNQPEPIAYCAAAYNVGTDFGRTINLGGFSAPNGVIRIDTSGTQPGDVHTLMLYMGKQEAY